MGARVSLELRVFSPFTSRANVPHGGKEMPDLPSLPWSSLRQTLHIAWDVPGFYEAVRREHPDAALTRIAPVGPSLMVWAADLVREVFAMPFHGFLGGRGNEVLRPVVGDRSMIVADGAAHQRQRRLVFPAFLPARLEGYTSAIREVVDEALPLLGSGGPRPAMAFARHVAIEVILRTIFGLDERDTATRSLGVRIGAYAEVANEWPLLVPFVRRFEGRGSPWGRVLDRKRDADAALEIVLARRRASSSAAGARDVLSALLAARDDDGSSLDDAELRDALVSLLVAGHETTATALAWTFDFLAHDDEARAQAVVEANASPPEGPWPFLEACVKEALRLRPVLPNVRRHLVEPARIGAFDVPAGYSVGVCAYLTHTDPRYWPEPHAFAPRRWLGEGAKPAHGTYYPFGGGARRCVGYAFALHELTVILAATLAHREPRSFLGRRARIERRGIALAPERDATLHFTRTRGAA